ncbi:TPA: hypothetical protein RPD30_002022 [Escherichia coli]|nr:hypothetical protein [Escherichia coli]
MKQISLIEMDGFLKGKCIPQDLKVNETNAEYLVRKFGELESKLETALRECRSAGITIDNLEAKCAVLATDNEKAMEAMRQADAAVKLAHEKFSALAAENAGLKAVESNLVRNIINDLGDTEFKYEKVQTPATDAFLAEVRAQGVEMYADNLDNGADDAERGGFDDAVKFLRSEASGVRLFADQLRKGGKQ